MRIIRAWKWAWLMRRKDNKNGRFIRLIIISFAWKRVRAWRRCLLAWLNNTQLVNQTTGIQLRECSRTRPLTRAWRQAKPNNQTTERFYCVQTLKIAGILINISLLRIDSSLCNMRDSITHSVIVIITIIVVYYSSY